MAEATHSRAAVKFNHLNKGSRAAEADRDSGVRLMPTYEYKCLQCNHRFDHFQTMTDDPLSTCPDCGGNVKRLIGAGAGIIFKGSGFYCTDYKNTGSQPADTSAANATESSGKTDGKAEKSAPAKETVNKEAAVS